MRRDRREAVIDESAKLLRGIWHNAEQIAVLISIDRGRERRRCDNGEEKPNKADARPDWKSVHT